MIWGTLLIAGCSGTVQNGTSLGVAPGDDLEDPFSLGHFWADHGDLFWSDALSVYRLSESGGAVETLFKNDCGPLYGFGIDESNVYYGTCTGSGATQRMSLVAWSRSGGSTLVLDANHGALAAAPLGDSVYSVLCSTSRRARKDGTGASDLAIPPGAPSLGCSTFIDPAGTKLVIQGSHNLLLDSDTGSFVSVPDGRVVARSDRYLVIHGNGPLTVVNANDGTPVRAISSDVGGTGAYFNVIAAALGGDRLYWAAQNSSTIHAVELPDGADSALIERPHPVLRLAVDGSALFGAELDGTHAIIVRYSLP
jgi:hypothetical protein